MAKRKAGVGNIIYELDNDDIEISSDDEAKEPKKGRLAETNIKTPYVNKHIKDLTSVEVISIDSSEEIFSESESSNHKHNGGKIISDITDSNKLEKSEDNLSQENLSENDSSKGRNDISTKTIFDEDLVIDSPDNSDLGVVGCENRTPLILVRFKDSNLAHSYKKPIKNFILRLLKTQNEEEDNDLCDSENELEIWPEDIVESENSNIGAIADGLFFVDTEPRDSNKIEIPIYSENPSMICNTLDKEDSPPAVTRRRMTCFNCEGEHQLKDCSLPRNNQKITEKRRAIVRVGRYHVEDDQKYGHLMAGRISASLRSALGLKRYELPLYIYRMRLLGYPPGWLEEARISHSGITMFDSKGNPILDPEEEDGELCEPGSKDKFDIKKILDFPGFNVPASSRYVEEAHLYGLPQISKQDSKMTMLQTLAPNAVKAYKRKKLLFFPSSNNNSMQEQAEMELDSGDELTEFPTVPPLPDEAPPPAPRPPPPLPPSSPPPLPSSSSPSLPLSTPPPLPPSSPPPNPPSSTPIQEKTKSPKMGALKSKTVSNEKVESNNTDKVKDNIPISAEANDKPSNDSKNLEIEQIDLSSEVDEVQILDDDMITIDEDYDDSVLQLSSSHNSPTLDDLEQKKRLLLNALENNVIELDMSTDTKSSGVKIDENLEATEFEIEEILESTVKKMEEERRESKKVESKTDAGQIKKQVPSNEITSIALTNKIEEDIHKKQNGDNEKNINKDQSNVPNNDVTNESINNIIELESNPSTSAQATDNKTGQVKTTKYGTPILNVVSDYSKLPSDDKFAKDICDVINFENLPNSTGKYKQISSLLKKVKTVVDRIQDSS